MVSDTSRNGGAVMIGLNRRRTMGAPNSIELLPSLTILSGQTPAIVTDYYPNTNSKFVFKCKFTELPGTYNKVIYGTFTMTNNTISKRIDSQYTSSRNMFGYYSGVATINRSYALNTINTITIGNYYITINGSTSTGIAASSFTTDYPLVLFSNSNNGLPTIINRPSTGFTGVLYDSFDIYEGSTLMRSYHPAKQNGRVGLYESVTNKMLFSPYGEFSE